MLPQHGARHNPAKIGATDADADDVLDLLAGVPLPRTGANETGEFRHLVQNRVHFRHGVLAIGLDHSVFRRTQRDVQPANLLFGLLPILRQDNVAADALARTALPGKTPSEIAHTAVPATIAAALHQSRKSS